MKSDRKMDIEEIQAMVNDLSDRISEEAKELYEEVKMRVDYIAEHADDHIEEKLAELKPKIAELRQRVSAGAKDLIDVIQERVDEFESMIKEEMAEMEELGFKGWVRENRKIVVIGLVAVAVIIAIVANMVGAPAA